MQQPTVEVSDDEVARDARTLARAARHAQEGRGPHTVERRRLCRRGASRPSSTASRYRRRKIGRSHLLEVSKRRLAHGLDEVLTGAEVGVEVRASAAIRPTTSRRSSPARPSSGARRSRKSIPARSACARRRVRQGPGRLPDPRRVARQGARSSSTHTRAQEADAARTSGTARSGYRAQSDRAAANRWSRASAQRWKRRLARDASSRGYAARGGGRARRARIPTRSRRGPRSARAARSSSMRSPSQEKIEVTDDELPSASRSW